jgi:DNA-binding IscR family transcriptional regulator
MPTDRACDSFLATISRLDSQPIPLETLAEMANYSPRHAWRIVRHLEESGQIVRHSEGFKKPYTYQLAESGHHG